MIKNEKVVNWKRLFTKYNNLYADRYKTTKDEYFSCAAVIMSASHLCSSRQRSSEQCFIIIILKIYHISAEKHNMNTWTLHNMKSLLWCDGIFHICDPVKPEIQKHTAAASPWRSFSSSISVRSDSLTPRPDRPASKRQTSDKPNGTAGDDIYSISIQKLNSIKKTFLLTGIS